MRARSVSVSTLALSIALGIPACGDDGTTPPVDGGPRSDAGPRPDGGPGGTCMPPAMAPMPEQMMGSCCYRRSNADRLDAPELRLARADITAPMTLSTAVVAALLSNAFDGEVFNWLIRMSITGADVTVQTGYGRRNADGTFAFTNGAAPAPGDPNRWNPVTVTGSIAGETVSVPTYSGTITVPVFDTEDPEVLVLELPVRNLTLEMLTLSDGRSCVGARRLGRYQTDQGELTGFITAADADAGRLMVEGVIDTTLCMYIAGMPMRPETCADVPQAEWPTKPDSICGATGCMMDPGTGAVCDPTSTCNAWFIRGGFASQGVEITD